MKNNFFSKAQETIESMQKYLSSKFFRGIGKVIADRITAAFGEETAKVIEQDPSRIVKEVKGIAKKRVVMLSQSWERQQAVRAAIQLLLSAGLSIVDIIRIIDTHVEGTVAALQRLHPLRSRTWRIFPI